MNCWPLSGYAPGHYACSCKTCHRSFLGAKRSTSCLECAIKEIQKAAAESREAAKNEVFEQPERIVAAAVFHGACISLPPPARHHTILASMSLIFGLSREQMPFDPANQGFLTSKGRFVNRTEAYYIAHRQGQIIEKTGSVDVPELFSEDLW
ncbi:hypothetical protein HGG70_07015 [Rhodobacteraceae bacterium R_SAG4]|nr:hypothetical protein [Rhodobacteraceae bacterium R_SAG4]